MKGRNRASSSADDTSSLASSGYLSRQESNFSLSSSFSNPNPSSYRGGGNGGGGSRSPMSTLGSVQGSFDLSSQYSTTASTSKGLSSSSMTTLSSINKPNISSNSSMNNSSNHNQSATTPAPPASSAKKLIKSSASTLPHHKAGRVKVGLRCRPAFQDEIEFAQGNFFSIVDCKPSSYEQSQPGRLSLTLINGKQRDFMFDYVFEENSTQDYVYDTIARPVVSDVLKGFNGTIFAYGQTGTGKTYTMGILEFVNNEHAGIIPRAVYQIFEFANRQQENNDITISLSFLQLYRETIQDLLAPASRDGGGGGGAADENLNIREDPQRGFYVEGLQEYVVRSYSEAEALLNVGLENRAIAPTLMNTTSSRSHTVLTLHIEQRGISDADGMFISGTSYARTVRSKLLMVDLAGSERVRRTVSVGHRLKEAKSINSSLSALGNVIAALAEANAAHIPYRDSKLTRLLQDSLGGTASTALVATVGPAPVNYGETLSTIQFAVRCMAVKTTPIKHEEVDYAELCARLQEKLSTLEGVLTARMLEQQNHYEKIIYDLTAQLEAKSSREESNLSVQSHANVDVSKLALTNTNKILDYLNSRNDGRKVFENQDNWIGMISKKTNFNDPKSTAQTIDQLTLLVSYSFDILFQLCASSGSILRDNLLREERRKEELSLEFEREHESDRIKDGEKSAMDSEDPLRNGSSSTASTTKIGSHLATLSKLEAMTRIEGLYRSSNDPVSANDRRVVSEKKLTGGISGDIVRYNSPQDITNAVTQIRQVVNENLSSIETLFDRKDKHFSSLKEELSSQLVERRRREEEVVNWSYILKYLLAASSKLRRQLQREKHSNSFSETQSLSTNPNTPSNFSTGSTYAKAAFAQAFSSNRDQSLSHHHEGSPLQRVQKRHDNELRYKREDSYIGNGYQEKIGSRLNSTKVVNSYNRATLADPDLIDQIGPPPDDNDENDEDDDYDDRDERLTDITDISSGFPIAPTRGAFQSNGKGGGVVPISAKNRMFQSSPQNPPSDFAKSLVLELGVDDKSAATAMEVIDRMSNLTAEQLELLDDETRAQIHRIRKDLGIDRLLSGNNGAPSKFRQTASQPNSTNNTPYSNSGPQQLSSSRQQQQQQQQQHIVFQQNSQNHDSSLSPVSSNKNLKTFSSDEKSRLLMEARRTANSLNFQTQAQQQQNNNAMLRRPPLPGNSGGGVLRQSMGVPGNKLYNSNSSGNAQSSRSSQPYQLGPFVSSSASVNSLDADSELNSKYDENDNDDDFSQLDDFDSSP